MQCQTFTLDKRPYFYKFQPSYKPCYLSPDLQYSTVHVDVERFRLTPKTTTFKHKEDHFSIYNLQRQTSQELQLLIVRLLIVVFPRHSNYKDANLPFFSNPLGSNKDSVKMPQLPETVGRLRRILEPRHLTFLWAIVWREGASCQSYLCCRLQFT